MLKRLKEKKLETFRGLFPDHLVSKKTGSYYVKIGEHELTRQTKYTGRAITKGNLGRLGQTSEWKEKKSRFIYLISPTGRLMLSKAGGNFKAVSLKDIRQEHKELAPIFFVGRKYEWMAKYPNLHPYKFFQGFSSLGDAKKFLGFSFLSDEDFTNLFGEDWFDFLTPIILAKDKKNVVRLYKNFDSHTRDMLNDYLTLCQEHGFEIEIPAGFHKLQELHDVAVWEVNKKTCDSYSKEFRFEIKEKFSESWKNRGLSFVRLETPYEMYSQGIKQQHCIGTNYAKHLGQYAFYSFTFSDRSYEIQIYKDGRVGQFQGRKNSPVPNSLRDLVQKDVDLSFTLTDTKPDLENYPMIKNAELVLNDDLGW